jgi:NAD(P)-dependent dehydrogenase (short-subunit alcohol dehydrogenase family)
LPDERLARVAEEIAGRGGTALALPCDLRDRDAVAGLVDAVVERLGRIDILINGAGIGSGTGILDCTIETWDEQYALGLLAPFQLTQAAGRRMIAQGDGGRIVNLGSSSAHRALGAGCAYAAVKAGVIALGRTAAADLSRHGITVNTVVPGLTRTPITAALGDDAALAKAVSQGPLANLSGRVSEPEDLAAMILFLCMPAARQITAQALHVSAGAVV